MIPNPVLDDTGDYCAVRATHLIMVIIDTISLLYWECSPQIIEIIEAYPGIAKFAMPTNYRGNYSRGGGGGGGGRQGGGVNMV